MARNPNKILDADQEDEFETRPADGTDDTDFDSEDQFEGDEPEEFTDADVSEQLNRASEEEFARANKSRTRGRAPEQGPQRGRETGEQRAAKTRAPVREREYVWTPGESLDAPPSRPGMDQRWIRFRLGADEDPKNWISKSRGMWVPRALDSVPATYSPPTIQHGAMGSLIGVGDLILCERPMGMSIARRKFFRTKQARQMNAGQRHVKSVEHDDHPISVTQKTDIRPTVGRGQKRRVTAQDDGE